MKFSLFLTRSVASGLAATSALALVLGALPARADDGTNDYDGPDGSADPGVARLSVLRGDVDVKRADSGDTVAAAMNAPISAGDYVTTRDDGRAEIQYGYGSAVRVAPDTQIRFTHLDSDNHALQLAEGTVEMRVFRGLEAHPEVDTPSASVRPDAGGRYRVTVTNDGNTEVTVRSGRADVITDGGTQTIGPDSTLLVEGQGNDIRFQTIETVAMDDFDAWNAERDGAFAHVDDQAYADRGIVGADDLDQYGHWVDDPTYGDVWSPNEPADWSPYHDGRWVWESYYGWTWIGDEPWGYAPYHYGNWFYANNAWCWYPGPRAYAVAYRPALVGFFSFGFGGAGFGLGFGNIGWVPLAPYEPFHPWWGRGYYGNRTTIVNNINIRNVTINNYRNFRAPHSVAAVSNANFASGNFNHIVRVDKPDFKTITPVRGVLPVVPTQRNLVLNPRARVPSTTASAPLSPRFAGFRQTAVARPQPFTAQRETVAATAQKLYPEHAGAIAHPEAAATNVNERSDVRGEGTAGERNPNAQIERNQNAPERTNATPVERPANEANPGRESSAPAERPTSSHDPWSRFGGNGTAARPDRNGSERATTTGASNPNAERRFPATDNAARPAASEQNGGAWRRFNNGGETAGNPAAGEPSGNRYGSGRSNGSPSTNERYGGTPTYRQSQPARESQPQTYRQSQPQTYHASQPQTYHASQPQTYHQSQSPTYREPAHHDAAPASRPAASGNGGGAPRAHGSSGNGDKPSHEGNHGH